MLNFPDPDTGYVETEADVLAQEHEAAEEARYLEQLEAAHSPNSDPEPDYRELAIAFTRKQAGRILAAIRKENEAA